MLVRVAAPTKEEIVSVLEEVAQKEGVMWRRKLAERIADESGRNLRKAMLMMEAVYAQKYSSFILLNLATL